MTSQVVQKLLPTSARGARATTPSTVRSSMVFKSSPSRETFLDGDEFASLSALPAVGIKATDLFLLLSLATLDLSTLPLAFSLSYSAMVSRDEILGIWRPRSPPLPSFLPFTSFAGFLLILFSAFPCCSGTVSDDSRIADLAGSRVGTDTERSWLLE